jgi:NAD(P)-dependent dehydrogenase (short-subunit alcohol dehydrogenase family)
MKLGVEGLRVLVTAGGSGIGLEIARAFHEEGAAVHVSDIDGNRLKAACEAMPGVTTSLADVSDRDSVAAMFDEALQALGGLDVLVNNAGIAGPTGRVDAIDPAEWDRTLEVNITGQFNCVRLAVPHLLKSGNASIINLSSAAGRLGFPMRSPYAASKWAVVGFTKSLSLELGEAGVRVNAILPGSTDGPRIRSVFEAKARARNVSAEEVQRSALAATALKKLIPPSHLAATAVFLASEMGSTISGQAISVCGDVQALV